MIALSRMIDEMCPIGGLRPYDVANALGVTVWEVSTWRVGSATPSPTIQLQVVHLHYIVARAGEKFAAADVRRWLYGIDPASNLPIIDLVAHGYADHVLAALESLKPLE